MNGRQVIVNGREAGSWSYIGTQSGEQRSSSAQRRCQAGNVRTSVFRRHAIFTLMHVRFF